MTDIFTEDKGDAGNSGAAPQGTGDNPVFDFIGEGKQYADANTALAAIPHKDGHIANLEKENSEMRASLAEGKTLDDVLKAINAGSTNDGAGATPTGEETPLDMKALVKSVLQDEKATASAEGNVKAANEFMTQTFGDKAQAVAVAKADELGMSITDLKNLAIRSPIAYKALFVSPQATPVIPTTVGDVQIPTDPVTPSGQSAYTDLIKSDKAAFMSPAVQMKMMAEALADPEKFFNN